ncbi:hypothetical protein JCM19275_1684 [Nonlabens ulvanivorans]|uniref:DUF5723 domain-containing protein n=1 Tax=Nonlabens ulvanivorans TaxID=906888 RepID=A0A090WFP3_NONUL|nr:DUF5723 family protein [Nonlabens ulvanivorans]GAL75801.1 hypothetical protein JCM19275_1684 [Nonlabens ulvanivorans]
MRKLFYSAIVFLISFLSIAQSYSGKETDNYSGITSLSFNPANLADSRFKTDINLFQVTSTTSNDYYAFNFSELFNDASGISFEESGMRFPSQNNNVYQNLDVLGPSFLFNLSDKHSLAISTRVRGYLNLREVNGNLFETLQDGDILNKDFNIDMENFNGTAHAWAEAGLTYGFVVMNKKNHFLKAGVTAKYLLGAGGFFINSNSINGSYDSVAETISANGDLSYAAANSTDEDDDFDFGNGSSSIGGDIGLIYEYRPELKKDRKLDSLALRGHNQYRLKLGLSITDIGSITYQDVNIDTYSVSGTVSASDFDEDFEQGLEDNYSFISNTQDVTVQLPTALRYAIDLRVDRNIYIAATGAVGLNASTDPYSNNQLNYTTIVPRYESRLFTLYTNISFVEYADMTWGAGLRFGPLSFGSGSILSNLISEDSQAADFYIGLKIPFHHRLKSKKKKNKFKELI